MAYGLTDLENAIRNFEAVLNDPGKELASFEMKLDLYLTQIDKALIELTSKQAENENKYLVYKQVKTNIHGIQNQVIQDSLDHAEVNDLAKSAEYLALENTKPFLIQQQKVWLPYYLERDLQTSFNTNEYEKNKIITLCSIVKGITADTALNGEEKTKKIEKAIHDFAQSSTPTFSTLFTSKDPIKAKMMEWLAIRREATINPLLESEPALNNSFKPEAP